MFEEVTGSLELPNLEEQEVFYFVAFDKMKSVEDLMLVMASMGFGLSNKHFNFEKIKHLLDLDKPVKVK